MTSVPKNKDGSDDDIGPEHDDGREPTCAEVDEAMELPGMMEGFIEYMNASSPIVRLQYVLNDFERWQRGGSSFRVAIFYVKPGAFSQENKKQLVDIYLKHAPESSPKRAFLQSLIKAIGNPEFFIQYLTELVAKKGGEQEQFGVTNLLIYIIWENSDDVVFIGKYVDTLIGLLERGVRVDVEDRDLLAKTLWVFFEKQELFNPSLVSTSQQRLCKLYREGELWCSDDKLRIQLLRAIGIPQTEIDQDLKEGQEMERDLEEADLAIERMGEDFRSRFKYLTRCMAEGKQLSMEEWGELDDITRMIEEMRKKIREETK